MANFNNHYSINISKNQERKNILFRADSSSTIGLGHIMRDLVLASQYKDNNIIFATQNLKGNINHKIIEAGYRVEILNSNSIDEINSLIKKYNINMIIIDHYGIDYNYEKRLSALNPKLSIMVLDDTYKKHYCHILLNHNISANKDKYKSLVPKFCELRCGSKYTLIRDEFKQEKNMEREKVYDIFIAMGGADMANMNMDILKTLPKSFRVALITTTANRDLNSLKNYIKNRENISLFINSNEVAKLINQSKLAIVTPSVIVHEVLFMEIDFIAIKVANNQEDIYRWLKEREFRVLNSFNHLNLIKNIYDISLLNFIDLSLEEKREILEWRNHKDIRKFMYNQNIIPLDEHLNYIESLKYRDDRVYFLIKRGGSSIGVIDFTNITSSSSDFGIYAKPDIRGVGSILMQIIIVYAFYNLNIDILVAEVLEDNKRAIDLYRKFDFKQSSSKIVDGRRFIRMELKSHLIDIKS